MAQAHADDSLRRYLDEIGRYPLLSRAEEVQLAKRLAAGDADARRRLIESNLRLVVAIAKSYRSGSAELLDLVQEGTIGLMGAVDRYDWRRGAKFSSYAAWWIRHGIFEALAASSQPIRLPDSVRARIHDVRKAERTLAATLGREPSVAEVAQTVGLSVDQVLEAQAAGMPVGSLDELFGDEDRSAVDAIADPNAPDPLQELVDVTPSLDLAPTLERLPERSRNVIELRFGLRDGVARTADSVADELGVSRERVRQIEQFALRKLAAEADRLQQAA
jgi:RNA polymerase primary sigma factor